MSFLTRIVDGVCNGAAHQHSGCAQQILSFCHELGWEPRWVRDAIVLEFTVHAREYELSIHQAQDGNNPLFLCLSRFSAPATCVPADIFGFLLKRNGQTVPMAWQAVETEREGLISFSVRYLAFAEGLDAQVFGHISKEMLCEVIAFDDVMLSRGVIR